MPYENWREPGLQAVKAALAAALMLVACATLEQPTTAFEAPPQLGTSMALKTTGCPGPRAAASLLD